MGQPSNLPPLAHPRDSKLSPPSFQTLPAFTINKNQTTIPPSSYMSNEHVVLFWGWSVHTHAREKPSTEYAPIKNGPVERNEKKKRIDTRPSSLVTHGSTIRARTRLASESGRVPAYSTLRWPILTMMVGRIFIMDA